MVNKTAHVYTKSTDALNINKLQQSYQAAKKQDLKTSYQALAMSKSTLKPIIKDKLARLTFIVASQKIII